MVYFERIRWAGIVIILLLGLVWLSTKLDQIDMELAKLNAPKEVKVWSRSTDSQQEVTVNHLPFLFQNDISELREHRVIFGFEMQQHKEAAPKIALFSPQIIHGGDFYINGHWFFAIPGSDSSVRRTWYAPLTAPIPSELLISNQVNQVEIRFHSYQRGFVVPTLRVGQLSDVHVLHSQYLFISSTLAQATNIFCWVVGFFMLSLWLSSSGGGLFGYSGGATVLWATLFTLALIPELDLSYWQIWRFTLYIATGGLVLLMSLFLLEYADIRFWPFARIAMMIGTLGIPCLFLIWGKQIEYWLDIYWTGLVICLYVISILVLIIRKCRKMDVLTWVLLGHSFVATVCAYHDYAVQAGPLIQGHATWLRLGIPALLLEPIFLTHFTLPALLIIVGGILLRLHTENVRAIEQANDTLEVELMRRELELEQVHAEQRQVIAESAINKERNRILQDIHDGLGSRLVNLLLEARTGQTTIKNLPIDLQACLEDLRLLVSGQFIGDITFTDAVEEFCQRAARNLRGEGVTLIHDIASIEQGVICPEATIHTLRIIQEMVANTIKHSQATECSISVNHLGNSLCVFIKDNGIGFDLEKEAFRMKRGMLGINKRLKKLKAESKWVSNSMGTSLKFLFDI